MTAEQMLHLSKKPNKKTIKRQVQSLEASMDLLKQRTHEWINRP